MLPTQALLNNIATQAVAAGGELSSTDAIVRLAKNSFTPGLGLLATDIDTADFDGYADKAADPGLWAIDPATGNIVFYATEPAGGFVWETTGVTNLPQTIFGWVWMQTDSDTIFAGALFDTPIVLTASNQLVEVSFNRITMTPGGFF